jgi:tRNA pseudouridine55 synthase
VVNGILLLDKPRGLSSNAALQRVRRAYGASKAGHVGSLDPLASGMLPVCLGEATKVAGYVVSGRKCYRFTVALGARTSTGDVEGAIVQSAPVPALHAAPLRDVLGAFLGAQQQVPPMFSALKRGGIPLYRLARQGVDVERPSRPVTIHALELLGVRTEAIDLQVECSKGTYVRVLAEDIARALGTCGHVAALRRLWVEPFAGEPSHALEALLAPPGPALLPPERGLTQIPFALVSDADVLRIRRGQRVAAPAGLPPGTGLLRIHGPGGGLVALARADGAGGLEPVRVFNL